MNGSQMVSAVRERTNYRTDDPQVTDARILGWLNAAVRQAEALVPGAVWLTSSSTVNLAVGQDTYTVAGAVLGVVLVRDGERYQLTRVTPAELYDLPTRKGDPSRWAADAGGVVVWPVPEKAGASLRVRHQSSEATITTSTTPKLPAQLHDLLVEHAARLAHLATGNQAAAAGHQPIDAPQNVSQLRRANAALRGPVGFRPSALWR